MKRKHKVAVEWVMTDDAVPEDGQWTFVSDEHGEVSGPYQYVAWQEKWQLPYTEQRFAFWTDAMRGPSMGLVVRDTTSKVERGFVNGVRFVETDADIPWKDDPDRSASLPYECETHLPPSDAIAWDWTKLPYPQYPEYGQLDVVMDEAHDAYWSTIQSAALKGVLDALLRERWRAAMTPRYPVIWEDLDG